MLRCLVGRSHLSANDTLWDSIAAQPSKSVPLQQERAVPHPLIAPRLASPLSSASLRLEWSVRRGYTVTRNSMTAWVARDSTLVTDIVFRRAADLLGIDEALLWPEKNAEQLQVVHYTPGQKYDAHHDWSPATPQMRFLTLLLYLNDPEAGGQTVFPRLRGHDGKPLMVKPRKGSAVLFYNILDGA